MVQDLHGKWVLVTGAASGIGKEDCLHLAHEGCNFVTVDIDAAGLEALEKELKALGSEVLSKVVDVTDKAQVDAMASEVLEKIGTLDVLVNNAGIGYNNDLRLTSFEDWNRLMNINFMGVLYVTHAFLEDMIKKGGGQIVKGIKHRKRRVIESWINWMTYLLKRPAPLSFDIGGDVAARTLCERRKEAR